MGETAALVDAAAAPISSVVRAQITAFNTLAFLGVFLIALVVSAPIFSSNIRRSKPWFGQLVPWLVYSTSFLLLVGRQLSPEEPPFGVCMFQAALIYASPPLCSLGSTCFVIDFYLQFTSRLKGRRVSRIWEYFLVLLPPAVYVIVFVEVILIVQDPSTIQRDPVTRLYCHSSLGNSPLISALLVVLSGVIMFPLEIWIGILMYRNWRSFRGHIPRSPGISLSMYVRMALFSITAFLAVGLGAFIIGRISNSVATWSVLLPTLPIIAAIAFGTQSDILQAFAFWRRLTGGKPATPTASAEPLPLNTV